jgi:phosphoribosylaminoimidazolecarboxamide formyltransferase/IMP cyclohydrolase
MYIHPAIQRALISVSDKTGILPFAEALHQQGIQILSTGGTAHYLRMANIPVQEVSDYTQLPEMMEGRLKTLHHKVQGGLLGRREETRSDTVVMAEHGIEPIDLLVVNLYPFVETTQQLDKNNLADLPKAIEQIDIGGPTMLRAAAKNYRSVTVITNPEDYAPILQEIIQHKNRTTLQTRFALAQKVFAHTAQYDADIANYLHSLQPDFTATPPRVTVHDFPNSLTLQFHKKEDLRYGENPHQKAAFYVEANPSPCSIATAKQHQGKALSFNNIVDTNAALECVKLMGSNPACVIVKHANPCGVAIADTQLHAYMRAFATDSTSAFGGILAFNTPVSAKTAQAILENQFLEVLIAPDIEKEALHLFAHKPNIRILSTGMWEEKKATLDYQRIHGGLLVQESDSLVLHPKDLKIVTKRAPTVQEFNDLLFAWEVVKCVKSNAIVYAKDRATIGIGAGQMSRVFSAIIAGMKAADAEFKVTGSVMASDAFFPFKDGIEAAINNGVTAIIQPGGSIRDAEVIDAANKGEIAMLFTQVRHFKH